MGCGSSSSAAAAAEAELTRTARLPRADKPLEDWDAQEVAGWLGTLVPDLAVYRRKLLDEGCMVARWTEQFLTGRGVPRHDAQRLIVYRDRAMAKASAAATASSAAASSTDGAAEQAVVRGLPAVGQPVVPASGPSANPSTAITASIQITAVRPPSTSSGAGRMQQQQQQQPQAAADAQNKESKHESLVALAQKGVRLARLAIEKLGPSLPFPGAEAAHLLAALLDLVDTAIANHTNLAQLRKRALAFMDILAAYHMELEQLRYKQVVDEYKELLEGIKAYAQAYVERNCLMRLLTVSSDKEHYEDLVASMAELSDKVRTTVALDSNAKLLAVHAVVEESRLLLKQDSLYQDPAAAARLLVAELGGLKAVMADGDKLRQVMQQLDVSARITIETVASLLSSHLDNGPQRHILQPDLRLFWNKHYAGEAEVPWFAFWTDFPALLKDNPADAAMVDELGRLLADGAARAAFVQAVERSNRTSVSVWELKVAFSGDEGLLEQVSRMLVQVGPPAIAAMGGHSRAAGNVSIGALKATAAATVGSGAAVASASMNGNRCQLPPMVANYVGRDEEAANILDHLLTRGSLALLAPGGMGKSCLAADVGWQMVYGGWAPGGALWVDLREASCAAEVEARFCIALGLQPEASSNSARILAAVKALLPPSSATGASPAKDGEALKWHVPPPGALLVVDNAEDALLAAPREEGGGPAASDVLLGLLHLVLVEAPAARLLVTSRTAVVLTRDATASSGGPTVLLTEHNLGAIGLGPASQLVRAVAADLTEVEAGRVAEACACVPLVLDLVAEALVAGRLALEDLPRLTAATSRSEQGVAESTSRTVQLLLGGLHRSHQHAAVQLSVFPSTFDEEAAAAVLGVSQPQAQATLALLYRHSILQRGGAGPGGGGRRQFTMHMVVRQQATQLGRQLAPALLPAAEGRFIASVLGLLGDLATMYRTAKQWRLALAMARDRQADIGRVLDMIGGGGSDAVEPLGGAAGTPDNAAGDAGAAGRSASASSRPAAGSGYSGSTSPEAIAAALTAEVLKLLDDLGGTTQGLEAASTWLLARVGMGSQESELARGTLLYMTAWLNDNAGRYRVAEAYQRQALELRRRVLGEEHPDTAASINNLAMCIKAQGRYAEAEPLYRQALELRQRILGEEHPDTAASIDSMATCIQDQGRYAEAEPLYRQGLELQRRLLGEEHPSTLNSINNLASCIQDQGRSAEAEALYWQALELQRRVLGEEHFSTFNSINNLASCIHAQGRYAEAERLFRQALELSRVLGEEHPKTAAYVYNLASCIQDQGRNAEAEPLYRQTLELRRRVLGEEHPDTAASISSVAVCIKAQGRYAEAEPLYWQALELQRRVLGEEHPSTLNSINNRASCIHAQGRYAEAERLFRQAFELSRRVLGEEHPKTAAYVYNLAGCIQDQGRYAEAEPLYRQALELQRRLLGEEHPSTLNSINNLASCIHAQGRYAEAERLFRQALELSRRVLGEEHPNTATSINNLASCIEARGRNAEAEPLFRQALELQRRLLGEEHPNTLDSVNKLAACIKMAQKGKKWKKRKKGKK